MVLKLKHRRRRPRLQAISSRPLALVGPSSFVLQARPQDDGAMWPALAWRCRQVLPERLRWAEPLLDPQHPRPVLCGERQVVELYHWLDALPNTERVSIACQRKAPNAGNGAHQRPAAVQPPPSKPKSVAIHQRRFRTWLHP